MLKRILPIIIVFFSLTFSAYGQGGPPADLMQEDITQQDQDQEGLSQQDQKTISQQDQKKAISQQDQDQEAHALEKEKSDPNKIGNLSQGSLMENFKKGGIIMYFILACSVIGVYVTIERMFSLQRSRILPRKFINNILNIISTAPPRIQGQGMPYPPPDPYQPFSPPQAPQADFENPLPLQTEAPTLQTEAPPSAPSQQDPGGTGAEVFPQEPPKQAVPGPEPVTDNSGIPSETDRELQKDMDGLLDILNKGLGETPSETGSTQEQSPENVIPPGNDSDEPDQGPGSGSVPMNMSYPAGSSVEANSPFPRYNSSPGDTMAINPGGGGLYGDQSGYGPMEKDVVNQIIDYCEGKNVPLARVLKSGLLVYNEGILSMKSAITNANMHEGAIMEKGVGALGVLANVTPLLGLLGTVTGMIKAFEMISIGGTGRPEIVATGIAEALTTTAGGLFVGIPLLLLFHWLQGKIETMMIDLQEFSVDVVEKIIRVER